MSRPTNAYVGASMFRVWIQGITDPYTGFYKMAALTSGAELVEFKHGTDMSVRKMPGREDWEDLELERYWMGGDELWEWRQRIEAGIADVRTVRIDILRNDQTPVASFTLHQAYPLEWVLPGVDASKSEIMVEKIVLAFHSVTRG